jgi:hypothetical protein
VIPELVVLDYIVRLMRQRLADARHDERGMTTETVIITAILAALALAVGAIIVTKVTTKANNIPTGQ